jgi:CHAT domain-containing protein
VEAGAAATRGAVARALATRAVVHVAGHGFEAEEAPGLAGVRVADGWFGIEDLPRRIAARLVVLAACRTGRESTPAALAWGGLPMALLAAGARHVVWTADDVEDDVTADLMERFHARLGASPVPLAYAEAIRACHETRGSPAPLLPFRLSGVPSRRDAPLHGVTP